jgi:hypothetical protein
MIRRALLAQMASLLAGIPPMPGRATAVPLRKKLDRAIATRDGAGAHDAIYSLWSDYRAHTLRVLAGSADESDG